jgi:hypothetical protein
MRAEADITGSHRSSGSDSLPIRAESPRIPTGGIDLVASRARDSSNLRAAAVKLDLENDTPVVAAAAGGNFGGFASARGMKRSISEDQGQGQGQGQYGEALRGGHGVQGGWPGRDVESGGDQRQGQGEGKVHGGVQGQVQRNG